MLGCLVFWLLLSYCYGDTNSSSGSFAEDIDMACNITRYPQLCRSYASTSQQASQAAAQPTEFARVNMEFALDAVGRSLDLARDSSGDMAPPLECLLNDTIELLEYSFDLLQRSKDEDLQRNESITNAHHWLSAALTYYNDCDEFLYNYTLDVPELVSHIEQLGIPLLSNALSLVAALAPDTYNLSGSDWDEDSPDIPDRDLMQQKTLSLPVVRRLASAVVTKAPGSRLYGLPTYASIQDAVNDAPAHQGTGRYIIYIAEGTYDEIIRVPKNKTSIAFLGAGINRTVITGSRSTLMNLTTYRTPILSIEGDRFMGRDFTVVNTAGPGAQAVAMRVDSDMSAFYSCSFWGYQDTLYTHAYRQFYKHCFVYGTVDFIFGNAASVFQDCTVQIRPSPDGHSTSTITAHGRTDPAQATAFVCQSCCVVGTPEYTAKFRKEPSKHQAYLGRPWKTYARAVFIQSYLDVVVAPAGWMPWNLSQKASDLGNNTLLGEYRSFGPGANPFRRVAWSKQLNFFSALQFSVLALVQGAFWLPFAGVPFRLAF